MSSLITFQNAGKKVSSSPELESGRPNAAQLYLLKLNARQSRLRMKRLIERTAKIFGFKSMETCPWHQLTRAEVLALKTMLEEEGLAPNTINLYLSAMRGVAHEAWIEGWMDDRTYLAIKDVKSERGYREQKGRALTPVETQRLIRYCSNENTPKGSRDALIFALGVGCGLRRDEIANVKIKNLDLINQELRIIGKGNKRRSVFLSGRIIRLVKSWIYHRKLEKGENLLVPIHRFGNIQLRKSMTPDAIYQIMVHRASELQIEKFSPHDLRRTFATRLFENGADINTVKDAMGHASISTTQRYDRRGQERIKEAMQSIKL